MTMDYVKELEDFNAYLNGKVSEGTVKVYVDALWRWFRQLNGVAISKESAQTYVDFVAKTRSASTANLRARAIERYFRWKGMEIHLDTPTIPAPEPEYLSVEQIRGLLAKCRTLLERVLITVLFDTGVRINELLGLTTRDINWNSGFISVVRKGGRREEVNISPKALDILEQWLNQRQFKSEVVFGSLSYYEAWMVIKKLGKRASMDIHPHMTRHSRAIQLLSDGVPLNIVQQLLGHLNIATTANIYGRFKAMDLKKHLKPW